jgi:copper(I)-binding protein
MRTTLLAALAALLAIPALAHDGVKVENARIRATGGAGAAYFTVDNHSEHADRLISVATDKARAAELHQSKADASGMMQMLPLPEGIAIPGKTVVELAPGGLHVMLLGFAPPAEGEAVTLTLTFERSGEITVEAPLEAAMKSTGDSHQGHAMHGTAGATGHDAGMHHGHAATPNQAGLTDDAAIVAVLKAQFDRPEAPLSVAPVIVPGRHAIAGWAQDGMAGRALLEKGPHGWAVRLCAGAELRDPAFLAQEGIDPGSPLSRLFNQAEDALGPEHVALASGFEGIVRVGH